ncbi:hypothetical protein HOY80DRAFT_1137083 [Tuber brumale]|nr:hypothetical protein HOY80DRAFT_1137083 [Tuber brumale]
MFPPGRGNDKLDVGDIYLISLFGRNQMLTAVGEELCLRIYPAFAGQEKSCSIFGCAAQQYSALEWLIFTRLSLGGYSIRVQPDIDNRIRPLQHIDGTTPSLQIAYETWTHFGLHRIKHPVFRRFEWVVPGRLARSSAPYFDGDDSDESINQTSIEFLHHHQIKNIISLNSVELSPREKGRLRAANISYSHIRAVECAAVTQEQFDQIWNAYHKAGTTLVYCGYGDGRTGMAISAIQLFEGRTLSELDYRENGLQCHTQLAAVENHDDAGGTSDTQPPQYAGPEKKKL